MKKKQAPNKKNYPFFRLLRRWWIEFTCTHWNNQMEWSDGEGWNIVVCNRCQRAQIFTDNQRPVNIDQLLK